jgi:signal transduction histidine kinase
VPEPLPALLGDRRSLKQVLINLLGNAVKFTPEGGRISVAASMAGGSIEIVIRDNGTGIPKDRIADLCQPFKRNRGKRPGGERVSGWQRVACFLSVQAWNRLISRPCHVAN